MCHLTSRSGMFWKYRELAQRKRVSGGVICSEVVEQTKTQVVVVMQCPKCEGFLLSQGELLGAPQWVIEAPDMIGSIVFFLYPTCDKI